MSNKEELAALMASDGDYEKKISLLKKAVVTVTKQKQEVEGRNIQLQEELRTTTQQLTEAQRETGTLQRRMKALEAQLEQERTGSGGGSAFGQNMLKGLSSIMGNNDASGRGGGGRGRGRGGNTEPKLALSAEDVERLVTENEQLHREKYTYKTKMEDAQRAAAKDAEDHKAEVSRLQKDVAELHSTLDDVTIQCDRLNNDCRTERAVGDFCRHFFVVTLRRGGNAQASGREAQPLTAELRWPSAAFPASPHSDIAAGTPRRGSMPEAVREEVVRALQGSSGTVKTLLRSVSVLLVMLREQLPRRERATVGDLEWLRDRLSVFLDAHTIKKDRLMYLLEQLDKILAVALPASSTADERLITSSGDNSDEAIATFLLGAQEEILQLFIEWVGLLRAQTPLLVESCVSYLPQGHVYTMQTGRAGTPSQFTTSATTTNRAQFVEELIKYGCTTLASVEGTLTALRMLLERSPTAYRGTPTDGADSANSDHAHSPVDLCALLALQRFWWEGCSSARELLAAVSALDGGVRCLAEGCDKCEIRDALNFLSRCLHSLAMAAASAEDSDGGGGGRNADAAIAALQPPAAALSGRGVAESLLEASTAPPPPFSSSFASHAAPSVAGAPLREPLASPPSSPATLEAYEEVLVALSAADRAAVAYHTQMNHLYLEMADREDAVQTAAEAAQHMKELLKMERAEAEHTRQTMQAQISLLSNQLIEMADAAKAQSAPHTQQFQRAR